jgi:hypothetical protein
MALNIIRKELFSELPDRHWSLPRLLFNENQSSFPEIQWLWPNADHYLHQVPMLRMTAVTPLLLLYGCMARTATLFSHWKYIKTNTKKKVRTENKVPSRETVSLLKWSKNLHMKCHPQQTNNWFKDCVCCLQARCKFSTFPWMHTDTNCVHNSRLIDPISYTPCGCLCWHPVSFWSTALHVTVLCVYRRVTTLPCVIISVTVSFFAISVRSTTLTRRK